MVAVVLPIGVWLIRLNTGLIDKAGANVSVRTRTWIVTATVIAVLVVVHADGSGQQTAISVGLIEGLSGRVLLRDDAGAKPIVLDPKQDLARLLFVGQQLQCAAGGQAQIRIGGTIRIIQGPSDWVTLSRPPSSSSTALQAALDEYGRIGGRTRGPSPGIFVPADKGVAQPGDFTMRWSPTLTTSAVTLTVLESSGGSVVWRQDAVPGTTGVLVSPTARAALVKYRTDRGSGPLIFRMEGTDGQQMQVTFSLLTMDAEQILNKELADWKKEAGAFLPHLGRAMTYARAGLFIPAAEEYEAALREAPASRDLITRTIRAEELIGNSSRVAQLMKH